jgi:hypothetical protein
LLSAQIFSSGTLRAAMAATAATFLALAALRAIIRNLLDGANELFGSGGTKGMTSVEGP